MRYLKTYEGLFDFFKKKPKKVDNTDFLLSHEEDVKDCFVEISQDKNLHTSTYLNNQEWLPAYGDHIFLTMKSNDNLLFELDNNMIESFEFANSYLLDLGLKIERYILYIYGDYDDIKWLGDIYFDDINELRDQLEWHKEASKNIEDISLIIKRV